MGDVFTLLCLRSAELIKAFGLRNLYYIKVYVVMLLESQRKQIRPAPSIFKSLVSYMPGSARNLKQL